MIKNQLNFEFKKRKLDAYKEALDAIDMIIEVDEENILQYTNQKNSFIPEMIMLKKEIADYKKTIPYKMIK